MGMKITHMTVLVMARLCLLSDGGTRDGAEETTRGNPHRAPKIKGDESIQALSQQMPILIKDDSSPSASRRPVA